MISMCNYIWYCSTFFTDTIVTLQAIRKEEFVRQCLICLRKKCSCQLLCILVVKGVRLLYHNNYKDISNIDKTNTKKNKIHIKRLHHSGNHVIGKTHCLNSHLSLHCWQEQSQHQIQQEMLFYVFKHQIRQPYQPSQ